ncbi:MAG: hypothetical protein KatS3mg111_3267 [Pirellulaceae bacterium]|nr:MAG: hypothetical protein KatS3mg111_3267 [Pirellulaceae bacterium]
MNHRTPFPIVVGPNGAVQQLRRLPRSHEQFGESYLQDLLARHPELLPVRELRDDVGTLLCIGREVPLPSGAIDNLYLSTEGYPVIVETKLWRNPQARREVLSQTLDYVKDIVRQDFEWMAQQWWAYARQRGLERADLVTRLNQLSDEEIDEPFMVDRVNRALRRGDVIALIVGDGIETRLQELVAHLCRDSAHLRYTLGLVELQCYQLPRTGTDDDLLVVPRVVRQVEPIQRAYVRVDVAEPLQEQVVVTPVVEPPQEVERKSRVSLTEEEFLDAVEQAAGRECRQRMFEFYTDLVESFGLEPVFKAAAVMLKVPHPDGEEVGASVLALEKQGRIYNTEHLLRQLKRWKLNEQDVERIVFEYWEALHAIDPRFRREGIVHAALSHFLPFMEITDQLPAIKQCVGRFVANIRTLYTAASP